MGERRLDMLVVIGFGVFNVLAGLLFAGFLLYALSAPPDKPQHWPPGVPTDIALVPDELRVEKRSATGNQVPSQSFATVCDDEIQVRIFFPEDSSIGRLWRGEYPRLMIKTPYSTIVNGVTQTETWVVTLGALEGPFSPWMDATISAPQEYLHQWIDVSAEMEIVYPRPAMIPLDNQNTSVMSEKVSSVRSGFLSFHTRKPKS